MPLKVTIIGAGSVGFTRLMVRDILCAPELHDTEFALMDINPHNLDMVHQLIIRDIAADNLPAKVTATTNQKEAVKDADYVFSFVRVGGLDAFQLDIDIPLKYRIDQCVGDTLGPGGIMYGQRTIPVLLDICKDIAELAKPGCLFLNYSNPMAMNTWACNKYGYGVKTIGLCHGVMHTADLLAKALDVPLNEVDYVCAGINHQTWFLSFKHKGEDLTGRLLTALESHPEYSKTEKVRIDMMKRFGYFSTESNGHLSEYFPWYRKRPDDLMNWIELDIWFHGETGGYLRGTKETRNWFEVEFPKWLSEPPFTHRPEDRTVEHGSYIIEALETGRLYRGHFNVVNHHCITNLPQDAIVEVPGYLDGNGVNIPIIGDLPLGCAAVCNASISVQRLAVEAAVSGNDTLLRQAMMMDPLTGAVLNPPEIWQLTDEMLVEQAQWLPQYGKAVEEAKKRLTSGNLLPTDPNYRGASRIEAN